MEQEPAQVCLNGHVANDAMDSEPGHSKPHCPKCGEKTIDECPQCQAKIPGRTIRRRHTMHIARLNKPPAYCFTCGHPYPWTEAAIQAAVEMLADEAHLDPAQSKQLQTDLHDLTSETPRTPLAVSRIQKVLAKVGKPAGELVKSTLAAIVVESIKRQIWPH